MRRPQSTDESDPLAGVMGALLRFLLFIALFLGMGSAPRWVRELLLGGAQFRSEAEAKSIVRPLNRHTGPTSPVR